MERSFVGFHLKDPCHVGVTYFCVCMDLVGSHTKMHWPFCSCDACQRREQQLPSGFFCKPCTLPLFWDSTYPKHANEYFVTLPLRVPLWFFWSAWRLVANDLLACTLSDYFMTSCLSSSLTFLMMQKSSLPQSTATGAPCSEAHTASSAGLSGVHGLGRFFPIKLTVMLPGWITIPTSCLTCGTTFHQREKKNCKTPSQHRKM